MCYDFFMCYDLQVSSKLFLLLEYLKHRFYAELPLGDRMGQALCTSYVRCRLAATSISYVGDHGWRDTLTSYPLEVYRQSIEIATPDSLICSLLHILLSLLCFYPLTALSSLHLSIPPPLPLPYLQIASHLYASHLSRPIPPLFPYVLPSLQVLLPLPLLPITNYPTTLQTLRPPNLLPATITLLQILRSQIRQHPQR